MKSFFVKSYSYTIFFVSSLAISALLLLQLAPFVYAGDPDNLGDHTATQNLNLNGNWLSGDGDNEGIWTNNSGRVGIGTSNPTGNLTIFANPSQTENLFEIKNSSGLVKTQFDENGNLSFNNTDAGVNITMTSNESRTMFRVFSDNAEIGSTTNSGSTDIFQFNAGPALDLTTTDPPNLTRGLARIGHVRTDDNSNNEVVGNIYHWPRFTMAIFDIENPGELDAALVEHENIRLDPNEGYKSFIKGTTSLEAISDSNVPLTIKGALSQSSNLLEVKDDSNANLAWITETGDVCNGTACLNSVGGDDLGDHEVDQTLQLNGNWISNDADTEGIRITNDGKVGIGSSGSNVPTELLEVDGNIKLAGPSGSGRKIVFPAGTHYDNKIELYAGGGEKIGTGDQEIKFMANNFGFYQPDGTTNKMKLDSSGNLGVGTSTPTRKLDVNGDMRLTGNIYTQGDICIGNC